MLKQTCLHKAHTALKARMAGFAGYDMPLQYEMGPMKEHEWVREHAGIFDVSHMGQLWITGPQAAEFLGQITPTRFTGVPKGKGYYTVLTNPEGGMIDDLIIMCAGEDSFFVVINAACKAKDVKWMKKNAPKGVNFEELPNHALIALQGQKAEQVLASLLKNPQEAADLNYMHCMQTTLKDGTEVTISRTGYTGEDGFEVSIAGDKAEGLWNQMLANPAVKPAGLVARDSLRLEMGYPLYGNDLNEELSPIQAGLQWVISKEHTGFFGHERIQKERKEGTSIRRVGVQLSDRGVVRAGMAILAEDHTIIGRLTSGGYSPTLKMSVGQGYVDSKYAVDGSKILIEIRDKLVSAEIKKMPFVPAKTKKVQKV